MSHIALTASATATVLAFHRTKPWTALSPSRWSNRGINPSIFASSPGKRLQLRFSATGEIGGNGAGAAELSESEKARANIFVWPDNKRPRVCILGGGFGGLYTALRLESLEWPEDKKPQIALVDQSERFVFKPMLYELLSGEVDEWEIAPRFSDLLANTSVRFLKDRVKLLHPSDHGGMNGSKASTSGGTVHLESGLHIEYDWLVLALGAEAKLDVVPGAAEFAIPFSTLEDARKVNNRLTTLERKTFGKDLQVSVAIVGCGYSGVELAATVAERLQNRGIVRAINVDTMICPSAPPGNREAAMKVLSSRKVELLLGYFVRGIRRVSESESSDTLTKVDENSIGTVHDSEKYILDLQPAERGAQSKIIEADLVLWTVGSKPPLPQLESSDVSFVIPLNARGQTETDETLRVKGHPRIFALGDSSALRDSNGRILPATAQVAFQQADFTGWNLWAAINGRPLLPFRFQNLGEMMTLGRNDAAISPSFFEGLTLEGPIGHTGRLVSFYIIHFIMLGHTARKIAYLIRLPTDEHKLKVGISWFTKSAIDSVASLQGTLSKVLSGS
ncbi:alternative NAD(P)H-ubiquinone oxidoreductase C1, chloroplastic/mitochondrial isoform X2 [Lotus japonicus]|nr:alternative NAD(P)H-ubiquinone oxidoreductase C1, chloroplastic/mitochondrial isoform X2 [Lotus japonicus]